MSSQYDDMMGSPMDVSNHPDNSQNYKMAGDVIPAQNRFPMGENSVASSVVRDLNSQAMKDIAARGAKAVDPTNLVVHPSSMK